MAEFEKSTPKDLERKVPKGESLGPTNKEQGISGISSRTVYQMGDTQSIPTEVSSPTETHSDQPEPYTSTEIANLTFLSFRFSQGSLLSQPEILRYIAATEGSRVDTDTLEESFEKASKRTKTFIGKDTVHSDRDTIDLEHEKQMRIIGMMWEDATKAPIDPDEVHYIVGDIRDEMIAKDFNYIVEKDGRPRKEDTSDHNDNPLTRTHNSHLVYYGLMGESTGEPVYDQMFQDIVEQLPDNWNNHVRSVGRSTNPIANKKDSIDPTYVGVLGDVVREVAAVHFKHYPQDLEKLPERWRKQLEVEAVPTMQRYY